MTPMQNIAQPSAPSALSMKMIPGFTLVDTCRFRIRTIEDAEVLSRFASEMFMDRQRAQPGLHELLLNAVEHGCLGIGGLKSALVGNGTWTAEVQRRLSLPENRKKSIDVVISRKPEGTFAVITDPGAGFDWKSWMMIDPARAAESHGRGIARAKGVSFDEISYNPAGNQVVVFSRNAPGVAW